MHTSILSSQLCSNEKKIVTLTTLPPKCNRNIFQWVFKNNTVETEWDHSAVQYRYMHFALTSGSFHCHGNIIDDVIELLNTSGSGEHCLVCTWNEMNCLDYRGPLTTRWGQTVLLVNLITVHCQQLIYGALGNILLECVKMSAHDNNACSRSTCLEILEPYSEALNANLSICQLPHQ